MSSAVKTIDITFLTCILFAFGTWTVWCVLVVFFGAPFDSPVLRAIARFLFFAIPAYILMIKLEPNGTDRFALLTNVKSGLALGFVVSVIWAALHSLYEFEVPWTIHAWMNVTLLSPIAEEFLFRRAVIEYGLTKSSPAIAVITSAALFALAHLPWWILSGEETFAQIAISMAVMFAYGIAFGFLYYRTKSIWSSLVPHIVNNLIAISLVR